MLTGAVLAKAMPGDQPVLLCEDELSRMMAFKHEFPATAPRYCELYALLAADGGRVPDDRRKAPMHSWRHFAKTYFKNDPLVKEEIHDAITGHGSDSEGRRYGVYELRAMAEAIARLPNPLQQGHPPATG